MKRNWVLFLLVAGLMSFSLMAVAEVKVPNLPKSGKTVNDFVPVGWKVLKKAEGDLNKDSQPDIAVILASNVEDTNVDDAMDASRPLLLLLKQADGSLSLSAMNPNVVLCKQCGGVFGDPLEDLQVLNGTVVLNHFGGSNDRWGSTQRFRFQDGDWYLIGRTVLNHNSISGEHYEKDENLLTGDVVESRNGVKGKIDTKKYKVSKTPLKKFTQVTGEQ